MKKCKKCGVNIFIPSWTYCYDCTKRKPVIIKLYKHKDYNFPPMTREEWAEKLYLSKPQIYYRIKAGILYETGESKTE